MAKGEPKEHILRPPLPWQLDADGLTECGLDSRECRAVTRIAMERKIEEQGTTRASFTSCMTCWQAVHHNQWAEQRLGLDLSTVQRALNRASKDEAAQLRREFEAIRLLVTAHREEFETAVRDMAEAIDLRAARKQRVSGGPKDG